ncbi:Uncharacterized protein APZ42_030365 [Daphnia magna]|uniref:Uncharacterized protein n=1 Tax=Daphnia magna TaxID=35525 RepID=A0A164NUA6_9CRUS|nr:Uncharacterized protein APZ42_030365 [Daphnia magna]
MQTCRDRDRDQKLITIPNRIKKLIGSGIRSIDEDRIGDQIFADHFWMTPSVENSHCLMNFVFDMKNFI